MLPAKGLDFWFLVGVGASVKVENETPEANKSINSVNNQNLK